MKSLWLAVKKHNSDMGSLANPKVASQRDPPYSNVNLTKIFEYHMLPCLRQHGAFQSLERNGFADIFQAALKETSGC